MKKKEYISPEIGVLVPDGKILDNSWGDINGTQTGGGTDYGPVAKGTSDWEEPEYDDDDGFGW